MKLVALLGSMACAFEIDGSAAQVLVMVSGCQFYPDADTNACGQGLQSLKSVEGPFERFVKRLGYDLGSSDGDFPNDRAASDLSWFEVTYGRFDSRCGMSFSAPSSHAETGVQLIEPSINSCLTFRKHGFSVRNMCFLCDML